MPQPSRYTTYILSVFFHTLLTESSISFHCAYRHNNVRPSILRIMPMMHFNLHTKINFFGIINLVLKLIQVEILGGIIYLWWFLFAIYVHSFIYLGFYMDAYGVDDEFQYLYSMTYLPSPIILYTRNQSIFQIIF